MAFGIPPRKPEKHMPFYKMLDIFDDEGCPVCNLVNRAVEGYFADLLYENVNDRTLRARFARDVGLCNRHVHQLGGYNDGLAIGILYRDIIAKTIRALGGPDGGAASDMVAELPLHRGHCLVCDYERDTESRMIGIIADFACDDEFRARFLRSRGLCIPHLARIASALPGKTLPAWLADFHCEKYATLLSDLDVYLESCNFTRDRSKPQPDSAQSRVWKKIPDRVAGYAGLPRYTDARVKKGIAHALFGTKRGTGLSGNSGGSDSGDKDGQR